LLLCARKDFVGIFLKIVQQTLYYHLISPLGNPPGEWFGHTSPITVDYSRFVKKYFKEPLISGLHYSVF